MQEKINLEINLASRTIFKQVLDTVGKSPYDCLTPEYDRLYKAYYRRNKEVDHFMQENFPALPAEKVHHLKIYLLAIHIHLGDEPRLGLPKGKRTRPLDFQRFIHRLLSPSKALPEVSDEGTSFFLTLFSEKSNPFKGILPSPVPGSQKNELQNEPQDELQNELQDELQKLIADETAAPQDRFQELIKLIMKG